MTSRRPQETEGTEKQKEHALSDEDGRERPVDEDVTGEARKEYPVPGQPEEDVEYEDEEYDDDEYDDEEYDDEEYDDEEYDDEEYDDEEEYDEEEEESVEELPAEKPKKKGFLASITRWDIMFFLIGVLIASWLTRR